ncbi:MAG TPA: MlaD family protein [Kofleriaceae bacterium]|nr:MlaD family protein [Kofleriaceae bacterium]
MFDDRTSRRVGAVVLALLALAGAAVVTLDAARLRPSIDVTVYFAHIGALEEGADVQVAGRVIGSVESVQLLPPGLVRDPAHPLHPGGGVAVALRVQERYAGWAAPNGEVFITAKGVLGDAYVEIGPPAGGAARARGLEDGDRLRGIDPPRMEQVVLKSFQNMMQFRRLLDDVAPAARELGAAVVKLRVTLAMIEPRPGAYAATGAALGRIGDEWGRLSSRVAAGLAGQGLAGGDAVHALGQASALVGRIRAELGATGAALDLLLADVARIRARLPADLRQRIERSGAAARAAVTRLEAVVATAQELIARVQGGQGTVGALLNDPEFLDDAKQLGRILKREPWRVLGHPRREALEKAE